MNEEDRDNILSFLEWKKKKETREETSPKDHHKEQDQRIFWFYRESEDRFFQTTPLPDSRPISVQGVTIEFPFRSNSQLTNFHNKQHTTLETLAGMETKQQSMTVEQSKAYDAIPFALAELLGVRSYLFTHCDDFEASSSQDMLRYTGASFTFFKTIVQKFYPKTSVMIFTALRKKDRAGVFTFMKRSAQDLVDKIAKAYSMADFTPMEKMIAQTEIGEANIDFTNSIIILAGAVLRREAIIGDRIKKPEERDILRSMLLDIEISTYRLAEIVDYFEGIHLDK